MSFRFIASSLLPTRYGEFTMHGFADENGKEHVALTMGDVADGLPVLGRVHSECLTGDAFASLRCDCGPQLEAALSAIATEGRGVLFYLRQEGRGIGLINKIRAYHLQDQGLDTVEANEKLGFGADMREYSMLRAMIKHLGIKKMKLMTNNPRKLNALADAELETIERVPLKVGRNPHNQQYLTIKRQKLGHLLDNSDEPQN